MWGNVQLVKMAPGDLCQSDFAWDELIDAETYPLSRHVRLFVKTGN